MIIITAIIYIVKILLTISLIWMIGWTILFALAAIMNLFTKK